MNKQGQGGFGARLWILGLSIVALLGTVTYAFVMPAYRDYQVRSKVSEVFVSTDFCRAEVSQIVKRTTAPLLSTSLFACDGGASSGVKISRYLQSIAVRATGAIIVTLDYQSMPELTRTTSTLTLVPLVDATTALGSSDVGANIIAWRCGNPRDGTTLASKYLPSSCGG